MTFAGPIARAIENGELFLAYQPQVAAATGRIVSVESLVRWTDPREGKRVPGDFVADAEASGEIALLGAFVMRRACRDALAWPGLVVAVNASPLQFCRPDFVPLVRETLATSGLPARRLEIEVTEGTCFTDLALAIAELEELRAMGVRIALDDFGTGYASLSLLRALPLDKVKIDRSFVEDFASQEGRAWLRAFTEIARARLLAITAEGVQTHEQAAFLTEIGVDYLQGYLYAKALSAEDLTRRLAAEPNGEPETP